MSLILSGTDGLSDIDGSAATPAIRGTDANTGIFFPAADTIAFSEGGVESMRIDSSGNVGIGSTPTAIGSYKVLEVNGTSGAYIALKQGGTEYGNIYNNSTDGTTISASGARSIIFQTNGAERMRIDSSGNLQFNSGYGSVATAYGCRAWVNFNGTGTVAIRASGNVSSITDNGTGAYTVNFSTALVDANYCINATGTHDSGSYAAIAYVANDTPPTTSAVRIDCLNTSNTFTDISFAQVSIFR
jgi:hypothetical protein